MNHQSPKHQQQRRQRGRRRLVIIFLDIDGVLLPFPESKDSSIDNNDRLFPNSTLRALNRIVRAFENNDDDIIDAKVGIVLSSTWRVRGTLIREILDDFKAFGKGPIAQMESFYDVTDPNLHSERQYEIYSWLLSQREYGDNIDAWIALDDDDNIVTGPYQSFFQGHVVQTDSKIGLTEAQAMEAIHLIREQLLKDK
jgi:hypothetical protein